MKTDGGLVDVDDEAISFSDDMCTALPPMSPADIEGIAAIVRRIDRRRGQR